MEMMSHFFIFILLWVYVLQQCCVDSKQTSQLPNSGPFRSWVISVKECSEPSRPYINNSPVVFQTASENGTLTGNMTFLRDTKYVKMKIRGFALHDEKWDPVYLINNLDCHGMVLHLICATMNIKYDRKNCLHFKGSYSFKNLDTNQLLHFYVSNMQYGHILWRTESYSQAGTFFCKEFETMTEPA